VEVRDGSHPVRLLNELELIRGEVWANIWTTDCIARINPASGRVTAWMLLHGLLDSVGASERSGSEDVLNGIAWDAIGKRLFLTVRHHLLRWAVLVVASHARRAGQVLAATI